MKKTAKLLLGFLLVFSLLFTGVASATAAPAADGGSVLTGASFSGFGERFTSFFTDLFNFLKGGIDRMVQNFEVKKENVKCTMGRNAVHMLKSVTDTIGDSFIITTEDGKVIVVDGGHRTEINYFIEYLKAVTGQKRPHIDAWFLSHPHDDHCEVFIDTVRYHSCEVTFDKVYANFPDGSFYKGYDEWAEIICNDYNSLLPALGDKAASLKEGDVFSVGAARFTVFYTFNPEWKNCNEASTIMCMDLAGTSFMFNGDAGVNAGNYVVEKYGDTGLLDCDICKMAHHGQDGVDKNFYQAVSPEICVWPTPSWVYENTNGNLKTFETRAWVEELGVKTNYISKDGTKVIRMKPRIVTTTDVFEEGYPAETAVDRLAALGYEGLDMGFDYWVYDGSPFLGDDYLDWAKALGERAKEKGISYTHAHSPGDAGSGDVIARSIKAAAATGARYLVVHPVCREKNGSVINSRLRFLHVNKKAICEWLPLAEEYGVVLLSENILWGASADPRAIAELVREVDSPFFGWCFDVGHAHCSGYGPKILKKCAAVPLSVHIQDNDGSGDGHLIPGDGSIDWKEFTDTLNSVGYLGDCVLEAHHQSLEAPDGQRDAILARLLDTAQGLRAQMK